jgi:hypothetical protein
VRDDRELRVPALGVSAGLATALGSLALAAAAGAPYLSADRVNGWIVVFAAGLLAALIATPFLIERLQRARIADGDKRWERALLYWGAISIGVLVIGLLLGAGGDFAGDSLAGSAGLLISIEAALVTGTMVVWLLSG